METWGSFNTRRFFRSQTPSIGRQTALTEKTPKFDIRLCPTCNSPMSEVKHEGHVGHIIPLAPGPRGEGVDVRGGLPVEVFVCPKCRFVKLYSMGRKGAEE